MSSESIAEEIYFDRELPEKWNGSLRKALQRLRDAVDVVNAGGRYRVDESTQDVDVWQLRRTDQLELATVDEERVRRLLTGDPFPEVELSPQLSAAVEEVASLRIALLERMLNAGRTAWAPETLHAVRTFAAREHYRHRLLRSAVQLHIEAGYAPDAQRLVDSASDYVSREFGHGLDPAITALVPPPQFDQPTTPIEIPIDGQVVGVSQLTPSGGVLPRTELIKLVQDGVASTGVLLQGESGAGKTALLRSLVTPWSTSGNHVLYLTGRHGAASAYGPFLAVAPSIEEDLAPLFDGSDDALLRARCWTAARRRLATEFAGLPLTIVVDDAQWLDSHSQQLIDFLASSQTDPPLRLIVAGRTGDADIDWAEFAERLQRAGLVRVLVQEFTTSELVELIGIQHPHSTSKQRNDFAAALIERKAALPIIAHQLIRSAEPETLAFTPDSDATRSERTKIWTARVDETTRRSGAVAAVLGTTFRISDLAALGQRDIETTAQAIGRLEDAEVLISEQRPDEFSFRHARIHGEFDSVLDRGERRRLHFDAAELARTAGAIHDAARHIVEAGAMLDNDEVVEAVLISARAFHRRGSYREAVAAFSQARSISDTELRLDDLVTFARAIASSGGDSWDIRSIAFDEAHHTGDTALSLEIALASVQRTEDTMGDRRRVAMLERVATANLAEDLRAKHASALARELGLLGQHERALAVSQNAVHSATNSQNALTAWLGGWAACRAIPPEQWPPLPNVDRADVDAELSARLTQISCAQALVRGDDPTARSHYDLFRSDPATQADPLRRWHADLLSAMFAFIDGNWTAHDTLADAAQHEAAQHGVVAAFSTRAAQMFVRFWVTHHHAQLLPFLEAAPPDLRNSFLAQAARASAIAQVPERHIEATKLMERIAEEAAAIRSPFSHPAAGLLASAPRELITSSLRKQLLAILEPFDGTALVVGASVSHAGPVSWSLANLAVNPGRREALLRRAVEESDRWNLRLWSVRCRIDLAKDVGDSLILEEARRRAEGTDLTALLK